ncbi:MAG: 50S ribosomal protein L13 [Elusimicrobiota bacterium]|nr:50S ribosomal protein L13 [Endomicrobiia bacterium]MDW8165001.1 50S ribosomal protein L13 [Elusimicrobiota bacterium]
MKISTTIAKLTKFDYKINRKWYLIDATGKVLGRLASKIAKLLIGKHKPIYSPDKDCGDFVVVKNASKMILTGKKLKQKIYFSHSGYLGGDKYIPYEKLMPHRADFVLKEAVKGMLPKNKFRAKMIKRLKVFKDDKINLTQKLEEINI